MAISYPPNPLSYTTTPWADPSGVYWIYNATKQRWARFDNKLQATFVQDIEPTGTKAGQFWYKPTTESLYVYDGSTWQEAGGGGGASVVVASTAPVDPETGTVWLDTTDDTLKVYDGTGWTPINTWNALTSTVDEIPFTILPPNGDLAKGVLAWDGTEETLSLGVANDSVLQIGQETLYHVQNASTTTAIANGTPVMYAGTVGSSGKMYVAPWDGNVANVKKFMGIATCPIPARTSDADTGYVTHFGKVRGIDTTGTPVGETWASGQILYLKKGAGGLTNAAPTAPGPRTIVALVVNAHTNGTLFVRITHGPNLGDDELVQLSALANRHALLYDSTDGRFENRAIVSADVSDATPLSDGSKIVLRGALGDAAFGEQISVQGISNKITINPIGFSISNEENTNLLGVAFPQVPAANRTITFPDRSGIVVVSETGEVSSSEECRSDHDGTYLYIGRAPQGSSESANVWTIKRQLFSGTSTITTTTATGVAWTDRLEPTTTYT